MGAFEYTALDADGREKKGVLEGDTPRQVRQILRERQLLALTVTEVAQKEARRQKSFTFSRGASSGDVALLTRQLATLVHAGLPLEESLQAVSEQTDSQRVQSILLGVRSKVMEGHALADGLADFPRVFPEIYRATVAAGEQSGRLDNVLDRLADYTESRDELRQRIIAALMYPVLLTIMCFAIVSGLLVYVVPQVVEVFEANKGHLPFITQMLIGLSNFMRHWGIWLLGAVVIAAIIFFRWLRNPDHRRSFDRGSLRLPLIGRVIRGFNTARFTRTFSILTASAVPVLEAMRISGEVISNLPMRDAVAEAANRVREGAPIGRALAQSKLFPPMTIHLISSGESSGELEQMLERAALSQERELNGLLAGLVGLLGLFVMSIVFAMLLPIFEMNDLIR